MGRRVEEEMEEEVVEIREIKEKNGAWVVQGSVGIFALTGVDV